ncbi:hypothetical protein ACIBKY_38475 [Nonomuraea sp. NPDC050394]|uniref:hypothetical protein n=1 Tax=Nonomuraea sp. NPDC050394 TaxID=3364363 RepID=UPI0037915338
MCIDVLCAYLRMPPAPEPDSNAADTADARTAWRSMGEVRATILRLITVHLKADAPIPWHGVDLDFTGIAFATDVDFSYTVFPAGAVRFDRAGFPAGSVRSDSAVFSGGMVSFYAAEFSGGTVSFDEAEFTGAEVDLSRVVSWSVPPAGLPGQAPGLKLPPSAGPPPDPSTSAP